MTRGAGRPVVEANSTPRTASTRRAERAFANARAYLLCSPHNRTGIGFTRAELEAVAELVAKHDVLVVADGYTRR
jgi:cystathionine beta-lyase